MEKNKGVRTYLLIAGILLLFLQSSYAQVDRYMVHLKDKEGTNYSIDNPGEFLSSRAIERRQKQNISITEQDLPVNQDYISGIRSTGADVFFTSKWFNAVLVQCDAALLADIESLPFVASVEYVAPGAKVSTGNSSRFSGKRKSQRLKKVKQEASEQQNMMIGVDVLHDEGITGDGVLIALMDGGYYGVETLEPFSHLFDQNKIIYTYDFVFGQEDVYRYSNHGTMVFSLLGAYEEDVFLGTAYTADYMLFVTEDDCGNCEHRVEEYNWVFAAEAADSAGVDIINTSLGYNWFEDTSMDYVQEDMDGNTAIISRASDIAFSKGILSVASAGNEGTNSWQIITAPADALNVISVGSVKSDEVKASSSSIGPSADNRIKPDVAALGSGVQVLSPSGSIVSGSGTSYSSPQVAGLCALIWQVYPDLTADEIRAILFATSSQSADPDNLLGYGIPNYSAIDNYLKFRESTEELIVYPNPVSDDKVQIRANNPTNTPVINLQIFSLEGQKLLDIDLEFTWQNNTQVIDMYTMSSGVYIFNLNLGEEVEKIRIVKI